MKNKGQLPPAAVDAEEAILGAILIESTSYTRVCDLLQPESFYSPKNAIVYSACTELYKKSNPVDIITVTQYLKSVSKLEEAGGAYYVTELTNKVASASNIEYHARIVQQCSMSRKLIAITGEYNTKAYSPNEDAMQLIDQCQSGLFEVVNASLGRDVQDIASIVAKRFKEYQVKTDGNMTGIGTGWTDLNKLTNGWQKSDLVIIAARPGMGKTSFVLQTLKSAAVEHQKPVAIFSLEMSSEQLVDRLISMETEVDNQKIKRKDISQSEISHMMSKITKLVNSKFLIDDTPGLSLLQLRAKAKRLKQKYDIGMLAIDYLQLMSGERKSGSNREQEISEISRGLKCIAKELNIPVLALSQLSRSVETRGGDKIPMLSDLRESGSIEQDADMVMFLYRPEYYGYEQDDEGNSLKGIAEVHIAKNRHGALDKVSLRFSGKTTSFHDLSSFPEPEFKPLNSMPISEEFDAF
jgi:replicative DNA helicase